jgi:ABC-2 type transport system permease protein
MNKTWLIIKREYLSRVRKKTFILSTILTPLLFAVAFLAPLFSLP